MVHDNYRSRNLIGSYHFWGISPRNSTLLTRPGGTRWLDTRICHDIPITQPLLRVHPATIDFMHLWEWLSRLSAQCNLAIKLVLPARLWLLPVSICFTCRLVISKTASTHTALANVYQVRLLPCKKNLTSSPEFGGRAGEPGDKAS